MSSKQFGIIGQSLGHSFSPKYFADKFQQLGIAATYRAFPLASIEEFPTFLQTQPNLQGLNVTIPYKGTVMPYLDEINPLAAAVGAVNTIQFKQGRLIGWNTDVIGFQLSLQKRLKEQHTKALVLGTGGASKAVQYVLQRLGIRVQLVSRRSLPGILTYEELSIDKIADHLLLINTTPAGAWPNEQAYPDIPYEGIGPHHLLYDLIYNPEQTRFLQNGMDHGADTSNGLEMLQVQAEAAWEIWNT